MEWIQNDTKIVTASADKSCRLIDVEAQEVVGTFQSEGTKGHQSSVKCVTKVDSEGTIVASGGRDGKIVLHDTRLKDGYAGQVQDGSYGEYVFTQQVFTNQTTKDLSQKRVKPLTL